MGCCSSKEVVIPTPFPSVFDVYYGAGNNLISPHKNYGNILGATNMISYIQERQCHICGYKKKQTLTEWKEKGWGNTSPICINNSPIYDSSIHYKKKFLQDKP